MYIYTVYIYIYGIHLSTVVYRYIMIYLPFCRPFSTNSPYLLDLEALIFTSRFRPWCPFPSPWEAPAQVSLFVAEVAEGVLQGAFVAGDRIWAVQMPWLRCVNQWLGENLPRKNPWFSWEDPWFPVDFPEKNKPLNEDICQKKVGYGGLDTF